MAVMCKVCEQMGNYETYLNKDKKDCLLDIHLGDNLQVLKELPDQQFDLIYIDPPFNTKTKRTRTELKTEKSVHGDRTGFKGKRYSTVKLGTKAYQDQYTDYLGFLQPRLEEAYRLLRNHGSLFLHLDYREVHYIKVLLDEIFTRSSFINEIIWAYDYGGRNKKRWSAKHDSILWYAKDPENYTFHFDQMERIPYMAPGLVGEEKAARGKTPTDCWWHTIVPTNGKEKTGYPTQKPIGLINRIVHVHTNPGDRLLDFFAGSGTLGEAAYRHGRNCVLIDDNLEAIEVMRKRLAFAEPSFHIS